MSSHSIEILDARSTRLGLLCLRRRELLSQPGVVVTEVTLEHELLMSSLYTESERALADRAIAWHGGEGLRVLVGGLGLGYTAAAALDSGRVTVVEVVELLDPVVEWLETGRGPLADRLSGDERVSVARGDIFARLAAAPERAWDVIVIDVDHSPFEMLHPDHAAFYTKGGLRRAREHLAPGGVLGVWSSGEDDAFARTLGEVFPDTRVETIEWRNELVDIDQRDDLFLARREDAR